MTETLTEPTAVASPPPRPPRDARYYELKRDIEEFLYDEAEMLDQRRFREWLDTLAEDLVYFMPMMFNVKFGQHETREKTRYEKDMSWFNEGKWTLTKRAEQILTGVHWAEEPLSRLCRLVTNVQLTAIEENAAGQQEVSVLSGFLIYQNRCEHEEYYFAGKRSDVLRRVDGRWQLARREIRLGQNVLLAKNLTMFF
ncbi:3-phenylpropionate dioxygenase [Variovorax paradoxus]|jgi:3-phenylpropionate/cinnamic acid dioxygenase small subunit|uniref:3-phenylpropionate/cinnamic acid dioxygenase subunit beta n=1 Tax=Variovorax TaxID=34072 RepID=UPI0006E4B1B7|nr:3-phenylpropionate/cinnamic acid dioxygenase subunit beta [Variovorax sp. CY25R-8]KPU97899.1 3-phenylpropionate dioxygenase [Variovorax paradoxus]KPV12209.1 3-phenylpropionate dioxygenase [Variovorax paradoxus]KPV14075.1 3-phenylpropionate dioxygenase [Variovorax paradoxus]KPV20439.1 3-phenylpropionate dioxygenase [Variovorax paradoxus]KPV30438.1 3-phenylpropionate dioxygenase [Variovorax paradoxus]